MIVDDHPMIRCGLIDVINATSALEVIEEAENGESALQKIRSQTPDIIILDISMPVRGGFETAQIINANYPQIKIVFLSVYKDKELLKSVSNLNIEGYLLKDNALVEIIDCLIKVSNGEKYFSLDVENYLTKLQEGKN